MVSVCHGMYYKVFIETYPGYGKLLLFPVNNYAHLYPYFIELNVTLSPGMDKYAVAIATG